MRSSTAASTGSLVEELEGLGHSACRADNLASRSTSISSSWRAIERLVLDDEDREGPQLWDVRRIVHSLFAPARELRIAAATMLGLTRTAEPRAAFSRPGTGASRALIRHESALTRWAEAESKSA